MKATIHVMENRPFATSQESTGKMRIYNWKYLIILTILAALYGVSLYSSLIFNGQVIVFRDLATFVLPLEFVARYLSLESWPPLWNPWQGLGKPFSADLLSGVLYPPNLVFRQLQVPLAYGLSIVWHHVMAAIGMGLFLRQCRLTPLAAAFGGLIFAYGGASISCDNMLNALQSYPWLPWVLWSFCALAGEIRKGVWPLARLAIFFGLTFSGGFPEIVMLELVTIGLILLINPFGFQHRVSLMGKAALAGVLALLIFAVQVAPFFNFYLSSSRAGGLSSSAALSLSFSPSSLLSIIFPRSYFDSTSGLLKSGDFWAGELVDTPWLVTPFIGFGLLFLFAAAHFCNKRLVVVWCGLVVGLLLFASAAYVPGIHQVAVAFTTIVPLRYPEKVYLLVHLFLSFGIAVGVDKLLDKANALHSKIALGVALSLSLVHLYLGTYLILPQADWKELMRPSGLLSAMAGGPQPQRIYANGAGLPQSENVKEYMQARRNLMYHGFAELHRISNINFPGSINTRDSELVNNVLESLDASKRAKYLAALSTQFVTSFVTLSYPELVNLGSQAPSGPTIYRVQGAMPRAYLAEQLVVLASDIEAKDEIAKNGLVPGNILISEDDLKSYGIRPVGSKGIVQLAYYGTERVDLKVTSESVPSLLVLADAFDRDWEVDVDNIPAEVMRANYFLRGVVLFNKESSVSFAYRPKSFHFGSIATIVTLVAMFLYGLWSKLIKI